MRESLRCALVHALHYVLKQRGVALSGTEVNFRFDVLTQYQGYIRKVVLVKLRGRQRRITVLSVLRAMSSGAQRSTSGYSPTLRLQLDDATHAILAAISPGDDAARGHTMLPRAGGYRSSQKWERRQSEPTAVFPPSYTPWMHNVSAFFCTLCPPHSPSSQHVPPLGLCRSRSRVTRGRCSPVDHPRRTSHRYSRLRQRVFS